MGFLAMKWDFLFVGGGGWSEFWGTICDCVAYQEGMKKGFGKNGDEEMMEMGENERRFSFLLEGSPATYVEINI